jgi:oligopeptide/dipeptide ABC transporter ATP-binding protein
MALLEIENLSVQFPSKTAVMHAVDGVSLSLDAGEVLGIVGESGSGKSVTMMALMGLVSFPGVVTADKLRFDGHDLLKLSGSARNKLIGKDVAMIFQDPTTSLNPCFTVGFQLAESLKLHLGMDGKAARKRSIELLEQVGIPAAESRLSVYPHQMSGGMNQRVMIAMAISCKPKLLIADEPTTALDVTIQAQILDLMDRLKSQMGMSILLITHAMGVVAETCQRVVVMYAGRVVEEASVEDLFGSPAHPYTQGLIRSIPRLDLDSAHKQRLHAIPGSVPKLILPPPGCRFAPRCPHANARCASEMPELRELTSGHRVACHFAI